MGLGDRIFRVFWILLFFTGPVSAQEQFFWTTFKDKQNTPFSVDTPSAFLSERAIERRNRQGIPVKERDLPVTPAYTDSIIASGGTIWYTSRWMNGAMVKAEASVADSIRDYTFVDTVKWIAEVPGNSNNRTSSLVSPSDGAAPGSRISGHLDYGDSDNQLSMLGAHAMHRNGYSGDSMLIAVLDAGFKNARIHPAFDSLFSRGGVRATYDFSNKNTLVYDNHGHGLKVWSVLAAYDPGEMIGIAYNADYMLFQTEEVFRESRMEEYNWLAAAEYADSAGADIINSSLGYIDGFEDESHNYAQEDMDGNTAVVTRAADYAASTGMVVVSSVGNTEQVLAPADGDSVLAVGAVDKHGNYFEQSAQGPTADGRMKPNLVAQGKNTLVALPGGGYDTKSGTSFSAPLISGLAAVVWQQYDTLSAEELKQRLYKSASHYQTPDQKVGYGIPFYQKVSNSIASNEGRPKEISVVQDSDHAGHYFLEVSSELTGQTAQLLIYDIAGRMVDEKDLVVGDKRTPFSFRTAGRFKGSIVLMKIILDGNVKYFRFPVR